MKSRSSAGKALLLAAALALTAAPALGADSPYMESLDDTPSGAAITFDLLIVRPVSLAATIVGCGIFVLQLPFSAIQGEIAGPAKALVVAPARYTFIRKLGSQD